MSEYPEKTCEIDALVRSPQFVQAALAGVKTEQRRDGVYGYPGERFELDGRMFEIVSLSFDRLGDMTDTEAAAEGLGDLESYRSMIVHMHPGMEWDGDHRVWVHRFRMLGEGE